MLFLSFKEKTLGESRKWVKELVAQPFSPSQLLNMYVLYILSVKKGKLNMFKLGKDLLDYILTVKY